ncbi:MAG: PAS domain-containing protein [Elusimicrobia bacterium]|nr:PAS domain-containing protein [Elusimicrobiota bacterium]
MTLLNRLLLIVFGAGLIPIIPAGLFLFYFQSRAKEDISSLQRNVSQMGALMMEREAQDLSRRFERMWDADSRYASQAALERALKRNPEFLYLAFTGSDGRALFSGGAPELKRYMGYLDMARDPLFVRAAAGDGAALGHFEMVYDMPVCRLVYPLGGGYYAFAVVNLRDLFEKLRSQRIGPTGGLLLSDPEGRALRLSGGLDKFDAVEVREILRRGPLFEITGRGGTYIGAAARVRGFDLFVVAMENRAEAFSGVNRITWLMAFFLLAVATAFYFSALLFTRRLGVPVGTLMAGAGRVSRGDFNTPVSEATEFAELSDLLRTFNSMMREVGRYHGIQVEKVFEEKQKLELLVSLIHDAIILCDLRGELLYANAAALALLGIEAVPQGGNETLRRKISGFVSKRALAQGGPVELEAGGEKKHYRISVQTLSPRTQTPAVFMVLRDITLERRIQQMKEDFFHSVAHDLRAPLLTMQGYIKLLEKEFQPGVKQAGYVRGVKDSSDRLFKLLENVLDISRMEAGQLRPDLKPISVPALLSDSAEGFRPIFDEKGVALSVDASRAAGAEVRGDASLLRRVLENLISNAWKFTPAGGKVFISAAREGRDVVFEVRDTGPGIPADQLEAVFEKYKRLKAGEGEDGFGLGLAIARKIVELHGGRIRAEAGPGGVFRIYLGVQG